MQDKYFNELKEQVRQVIAYSQDLPLAKVNVDQLMDDWKENKYRFYTHFPDESLIYQSPTEITVPVEEYELKAELDAFIDNLFWWYKNHDLGDFVDCNRNNFFKNEVVEDYHYGDGVIPKGMKIIKAFKYFVDDKDLLHTLQDKASLLIQSTKITGYFCMSVHPLDYLSSSENNHNWRSCHALDGEFRSGNLSYMADNTTIVCYMKSKEDVILPHFPSSVPWNNKKWRMLLYVSNDWNTLISGRHYPYISKPLENFALETFRTFFAIGNKYTDWCYDKYNTYKINDDIITTNRLLPTKNGMVREQDLIKDATKTPLHYNDPLHSTVYDYGFSEAYIDPYWQSLQEDGKEIDLKASSNTQVVLGHKVNCCLCGKNECVLGDTMLCIDCEIQWGTEENENFTYCADCGQRIYIPEAIETEDGVYCPDCFSDYSRCANCNDLYKDKDLIYDEETDLYYCESCYDEIMFDREHMEDEE